MKQDYYWQLGVGRSAGREEIRRAYRQMALKYHPDVNESEGATARFEQINRAYTVLSDPGSRAIYDVSLEPANIYTSYRCVPKQGSGGKRWQLGVGILCWVAVLVVGGVNLWQAKTETGAAGQVLGAGTSDASGVEAAAAATDNGPQVKCQGPDGQYILVSQQLCEAFHQAWSQLTAANP